jgi:hypothetical protein
MLSTIANIILLIALGFAAFFVFQRMRGQAKTKQITPIDPSAQNAYEKANVPMEEEEVNLTLQERIELSWQFLTNVTEQIMNRFSTKDQQQIYKAGQQLAKNGAKYQHDVHQEVNFTQKAKKARAL